MEHADAARAEKAILKELDDLRSGPITAEELEDCRRSLLSGMAGIEDTLGGIETWYYMEAVSYTHLQVLPDNDTSVIRGSVIKKTGWPRGQWSGANPTPECFPFSGAVSYTHLNGRFRFFAPTRTPGLEE